jgi:hypothetical protein
MRPKVAILILAAAVGLVAIAALLKAVTGARRAQEVTPSEGSPTETVSTPATNLQAKLGSTTNAAILEQLRAADVAKELNQIREIQGEGPADATSTALLLSKVTHPEFAVRKAALESLVQLNAASAVPGLEQALAMAEDPREKVALMDAIDYLKAPELMQDAAVSDPGAGTSSPPATTWPRPGTLHLKPVNTNAQPGIKQRPRRAAATKPGQPSQTQPTSQAPASAPPQ